MNEENDNYDINIEGGAISVPKKGMPFFNFVKLIKEQSKTSLTFKQLVSMPSIQSAYRNYKKKAQTPKQEASQEPKQPVKEPNQPVKEPVKEPTQPIYAPYVQLYLNTVRTHPKLSSFQPYNLLSITPYFERVKTLIEIAPYTKELTWLFNHPSLSFVGKREMTNLFSYGETKFNLMRILTSKPFPLETHVWNSNMSLIKNIERTYSAFSGFNFVNRVIHINDTLFHDKDTLLNLILLFGGLLTYTAGDNRRNYITIYTKYNLGKSLEEFYKVGITSPYFQSLIIGNDTIDRTRLLSHLRGNPIDGDTTMSADILNPGEISMRSVELQDRIIKYRVSTETVKEYSTTRVHSQDDAISPGDSIIRFVSGDWNNKIHVVDSLRKEKTLTIYNSKQNVVLVDFSNARKVVYDRNGDMDTKMGDILYNKRKTDMQTLYGEIVIEMEQNADGKFEPREEEEEEINPFGGALSINSLGYDVQIWNKTFKPKSLNLVESNIGNNQSFYAFSF